jgi:hypothetical protein
MKIKFTRRPHLALTAYALAVFASAGVSTVLNAQEQRPQPPPASPDRQNVGLEGTVDLYLVNPDGQVDGLLLNNNTIVRFPPHLSQQLTGTVSPDDPVKVDGFTESNNTIHAWTITDLRTQRSVSDTPPGPGRMPAAPNLVRQQMSADGTVRVVTYAPGGEPDGAILTDGTIVHVPPPAGEEYADLLQPGKRVAAIGLGTANSYGRSLEAIALGSSLNQLQTVAAVAPPRRGRR